MSAQIVPNASFNKAAVARSTKVLHIMAVFDQSDAQVLLEHQYLSSICSLRRERFAHYSPARLRERARLRIRWKQAAFLQVLSCSTCDVASAEDSLMEIWTVLRNSWWEKQISRGFLLVWEDSCSPRSGACPKDTRQSEASVVFQ